MNDSISPQIKSEKETKGSTMQTEITSSLIDKLRLPVNYGGHASAKKILTTVPVGKPGKGRFFRTHADDAQTMEALIYEDKEQSDIYIVSPQVGHLLESLTRRVRIYVTVDRADNPFLVPVPLPDADGTRNRWHDSLEKAVIHGKKAWIRIGANKATGSYEVFEATQSASIPAPSWPDESIESLVEIAFAGKMILDENHPVVDSLLGRV